MRVHEEVLSRDRREVADLGAPHVGAARLSRGARVRGKLTHRARLSALACVRVVVGPIYFGPNRSCSLVFFFYSVLNFLFQVQNLVYEFQICL